MKLIIILIIILIFLIFFNKEKFGNEISINVLGERSSGTNFLQKLIDLNFNIKQIYDIKKHFFENDTLKNDVFYICITRNVITWINSYSKFLWDVPDKNKEINAFVKNEWKDKYRNYHDIFEMRKIKMNYFLNNANKPNVILIKYEDLVNDFDNTMDSIKNKFNLTKKNEKYEKIDYRLDYKNEKSEDQNKSEMTLSSDIINYIKEHIDIEQEKKLGY